MKKWLYLLGGFLLGILVVSSAGDVSAQFKSMIGQKVTGEYNIIVNGVKLQESGSVINGRANAPVRALSDSLGAELTVNNETKTISITSDSETGHPDQKDEQIIDPEIPNKNQLLTQKANIESDLIHLNKRKDEDQSQLDSMKEKGRIEGEAALINSLDILSTKIKEKTEELAKVNEALKAFE